MVPLLIVLHDQSQLLQNVNYYFKPQQAEKTTILIPQL